MLKMTLAALTLSLLSLNAYAQEQESDMQVSEQEYMLRSSCRAREVERYYCPTWGGGQWWGPYWDRGCSVKCQNGQRAICREASCEQNGSGRPVESSCTCR